MIIKVDDKEQTNSISNAVIKCAVNVNSFNACISVTFPGSGANSTIMFEKLPLFFYLIGVSFTKQDGTVFQKIDLKTPAMKNYSQTLKLPNENITCNIFLHRLFESGELLSIPIRKPRIVPLSVDLHVENAVLLKSNVFRKCGPEQTEYHVSNFSHYSASFRIEYNASVVQSAQREQKSNSLLKHAYCGTSLKDRKEQNNKKIVKSELRRIIAKLTIESGSLAIIEYSDFDFRTVEPISKGSNGVVGKVKIHSDKLKNRTAVSYRSNEQIAIKMMFNFTQLLGIEKETSFQKNHFDKEYCFPLAHPHWSHVKVFNYFRGRICASLLPDPSLDCVSDRTTYFTMELCKLDLILITIREKSQI